MELQKPNRMNNTKKETNSKRPKTSKSKDELRSSKQKKKKLIIRNLSFKATKEDLQNIFSKFGNVSDINIPETKDGRKKGFAFIQFENTKSVFTAMKNMNYKEIHGRKVAIDYAVDKTTFQLKTQNIKSANKNLAGGTDISVKEEPMSESEDEADSEIEESEDIKDESVIKEESDSEEDEGTKRVRKFMEHFNASGESDGDDDSEEESSEDSSSEEGESEEEKPDIKTEEDEKPRIERKQSNDVVEGRTVFLRNVSFSTDDDSLSDAVEKYGEFEYCLVCFDKMSGHPKGTAFVKFKSKESADKLLKDSSEDPGLFIDGRRVTCSVAVGRQELAEKTTDVKKPSDKRNLYLQKVGFIYAGSTESEGVSKSDMSKRAQLEMVMRQKLRNTNFFISNLRLVVHNLPRDFTDSKLRTLFNKAAGKGAAITEARVMKEFKRLDSKGEPLSKGFGFVAFKEHGLAMKALQELNNNPNIFTPNKRPIVEFSVENKVALMTKEKRREATLKRNKKEADKKHSKKSNAESSNQKTTNADDAKRIKKRNRKKLKKDGQNNSSSNSKVESASNSGEKKQKRNRKKSKKDGQNNSSSNSKVKSAPNSGEKVKLQKSSPQKKNTAKVDDQGMKNSINKYKEKLLSKMALKS